MTDNRYTHDKENRPLEFAAIHKDPDYTNRSTRPNLEHMMCELQLDAIGTWELLNFNINYSQWLEDQQQLQSLWRPFQPKKTILNDRESILIYGQPGDTATTPTGLGQYEQKLGYKPRESTFDTPTEARPLLTCCHELFDYFDPLGRTFLIKLNAGGFYPRHRDHLLLTRDTVRLIAFLGDASDQLEWEIDGRIRTFLPNRVYYIDTRKMHRLSSWQHNSTMLVMNVQKNWNSVMKIISRLQHN